MEDGSGVSDKSLGVPRSELKVRGLLHSFFFFWDPVWACPFFFKDSFWVVNFFQVLVGEKRVRKEVEEISEFGQKRVKTRDLESVFRSQGSIFFVYLMVFIHFLVEIIIF